MNAYESLERRFHRIINLDDCAAMLGWDQQTMMPPGASEARGEQLATLRSLAHELLCDPRLQDELLGAEAKKAELDEWQAANLFEMRRRWIYATALPSSLVLAHTRAVSAAEPVWREAKLASNFVLLQGPLEKVLELTREVAVARAEKLGCSPYDALLDEFEPGARAERIDVIFGELAASLPPLVDRVMAHQASAGAPPEQPVGPFPRARQEALCRKLAAVVGFDFNCGRLDESAHPFTEGVREDVRITTRYDEADFGRALMGVLHEAGHALYEQGRPLKWRNQLVGKARGMSLHESQSLLIEMQACRSREFTAFVAPHIREAFDAEGAAYTEANLYRRQTRVSRSFIRVDADEVTYPLHVILRYRLERAMIAGELAVGDLPTAWNEGMQLLLGVVPPNDRLGCLQDIHWPSGGWGYFPTYTLGAMTAAQLFDAACKQNPDIRPGLRRGDFAPLRAWLREHVHSLASRHTTDEVVTRATGRSLEPSVFRRHLEQRYLEGR